VAERQYHRYCRLGDGTQKRGSTVLCLKMYGSHNTETGVKPHHNHTTGTKKKVSSGKKKAKTGGTSQVLWAFTYRIKPQSIDDGW